MVRKWSVGRCSAGVYAVCSGAVADWSRLVVNRSYVGRRQSVVR